MSSKWKERLFKDLNVDKLIESLEPKTEDEKIEQECIIAEAITEYLENISVYNEIQNLAEMFINTANKLNFDDKKEKYISSLCTLLARIFDRLENELGYDETVKIMLSAFKLTLEASVLPDDVLKALKRKFVEYIEKIDFT